MIANVKRPAFRLMIALLSAIVAAMLASGVASASSVPTGENMVGQSVIEPAYNDVTGSTVYVLTPIHAPVHPNSHNTAPFYVIVYPTSVAGTIGTVNCQHQPMDNCPDHGPGVAGLAKSVMPGVYGGGVWGHDHIFAPPGSGGDFNILWVPIAVLFTSTAAAHMHITTLVQLNNAVANGDAIKIPLPQLTFHCSAVAAATYNQGTPVTPAPPLP